MASPATTRHGHHDARCFSIGCEISARVSGGGCGQEIAVGAAGVLGCKNRPVAYRAIDFIVDFATAFGVLPQRRGSAAVEVTAGSFLVRRVVMLSHRSPVFVRCSHFASCRAGIIVLYLSLVVATYASPCTHRCGGREHDYGPM